MSWLSRYLFLWLSHALFLIGCNELSLTTNIQKVTWEEVSIQNGVHTVETKQLNGIIHVYEDKAKQIILKKLNLKSGILDGEQLHYSPKGVLLTRQHYKNGVLSGVQRSWHMNGKKHTMDHYQNGLKQGNHWTWTREGNLYSYKNYEQDTLIAHKVWKPDGSMESNFVIRDNKLIGKGGTKACREVRLKQGGKYVEVK